MTVGENSLQPQTLPQLAAYCAERYADVRALFAPHQKPVLEMTYAQLQEDVARLGAGLLAAGIGVGDRIALFSDNRPRWLCSDLAITGIGAVDVPRGSDTSTGEFQFILQHSGCAAAVLQDKKLYDRLAAAGALNGLRFVVMMDDSDVKPGDGNGPAIHKYVDLLELGDAEAYTRASQAVTPAMLATIVYTSGTTGSPKGVMLSHGNLMTQPLGVDMALDPEPGEILLSILPAWHAYERAVEYYGLYHGITICYSDRKYIREDLIKMAPHLIPCVPRIWEMIYKGILTKTSAAPEKNQKIFRKFMDLGQAYIEARRIATGDLLQPTRPSAAQRARARVKMALLYPGYRLGDKLVYSKIRRITGGRLRAAVSGGGSLGIYLDDFFEIAGVPILNGYGMTETSPVIAVRRLDHNVRGTVGPLMTNTQVSLRREDGAIETTPGKPAEIWVSGPQVMMGYYDNDEATAEVLTEDGWLKTGDLGWFTASGDLVIAGRAKDTIVLSSGENVEPDFIEDACRKNPLIVQIMVVGQDQKTLGALVVPDYALLAEALKLPSTADNSQVAQHPDAAKIIRQALSETMKKTGLFKASEFISKVYVVEEPFSDTEGLMTNSMKIRRNRVSEHYAAQIAALFK